jgi:PAP2 superfamily
LRQRQTPAWKDEIVSKTGRSQRGSLLRTVALELLVMAGLFLAYRYARMLVGHSSAVAFGNATDLIEWERALRLPDELVVQQLLLSSESVTRAANVYYATVHFPLTAAFLIWLFVRSRDRYREIRTSMVLLTGMAMVIHAAFPLAPARMLDGLGFVDTAARYGPTVYTEAPEADSVANQFAAMPSLHFGWAVVVAMGVIRVSRSRYRYLWIAHPTITLLVIVGTGNHYWADAAVAGLLLVAAEWTVRTWQTVRRSVPIEGPALGIGWPSVSTYEPLVEPAVGSAGAPASCVRCLPRRRGPPPASAGRYVSAAMAASRATAETLDADRWRPAPRVVSLLAVE